MNYLTILRKYLLEKNPDALLWIMGYGLYVHAIDDIVDEDIPGDQVREQFILKTFEFAEAIYSNAFYIQHVHTLRPLVKMASRAYMDSILWEHSPEEWKRKVADSLRQQGNEVILAVIEIVGGLQARDEASLELRTVSYQTHHNQLGEPV